MILDERLAALTERGFDAEPDPQFDGKYIHVSCQQCEALVICGTATHERGCPKARRECRGCAALVPVNVRYCSDCE